MPSFRVNTSRPEFNRFDAIGTDSAELHFIGHVGLAASAGSQDVTGVSALDMGPPLHGHSSANHMKCDVVGSAQLTDDEVQKIRTFIDRHSNEHELFLQLSTTQILRMAPQMYCVLPHTSPIHEDDGRYTRTRFSCVGFVLEAYKSARITLLNLDELPLIDMTVIAAAYPPTRLIERGQISADDLGLAGDGPWPVLLCGFLFHSLNRDANVIRQEPYAPTISDRHFH